MSDVLVRPFRGISAGPGITAKLARVFRHRNEVLAHDLASHQTFCGEAMNILVAGASGLVDSALVPFLITGGHTVVKLTLQPTPGGGASATCTWNPATAHIDLSRAGTIDSVVHLAGETIAQRWTPAAKQRIHDSRGAGSFR